jgi:hypothetical protein
MLRWTYSIPLRVDRNVEKTQDPQSSHKILGRKQGLGPETFIQEGEPQFHLRNGLARTRYLAIDYRAGGMLSLHNCFEFDAIPGHNNSLESRFGDFCKYRFSGEPLGLRDEQPSGLRHTLDHQ